MLSVIVGVVIFFVNKTIEKQPFNDSGLDFRAIKIKIKEIKNSCSSCCTTSSKRASNVEISTFYEPSFLVSRKIKSSFF